MTDIDKQMTHVITDAKIEAEKLEHHQKETERDLAKVWYAGNAKTVSTTNPQPPIPIHIHPSGMLWTLRLLNTQNNCEHKN